MQLNLKWIIIGAIFLILMVVMGGNSGDEAQRAREEAAKRPDALIRAIEEHNNPQKSGLGRFTGGGSDGESPLPLPTGNDNSRHYPSYLTNDTNPFAKGLEQPPPVSPSVQQQPSAAPPTSRGYQDPAVSRPPSNDYYPPPPKPPSNPFKPHSGLEKRLNTGQPLEIVGTSVYTLNAKGKRVPMPDGVYKMQDSQLTLVVRDGHKLAIQ